MNKNLLPAHAQPATDVLRTLTVDPVEVLTATEAALGDRFTMAYKCTLVVHGRAAWSRQPA